MSVLVTGGAGFIGRHLVAALVTEGAEVVVLDNLHRGERAALAPFERSGALRFVAGDVRERAALDAVMTGVEVVYHLAAQSNVLGAVTDLDYSFSSNVVGTYQVLAAAQAAGVRRLVFTSSREVYGEVAPAQLPVAEETPLNPKNAYGASKAAGELYCRVFAAAGGLDVRVLRLANVYGPGDRERVLPLWLERARRGADLELYGGAQVLDLVPVGLVVAALRRAADPARDLGGQAVNVGSGVGTPLRELAARVQRLPGVAVGTRILPARAVEVTRFVADVRRLRAVLGLEPPADPLADLPALWESMAAGQ